MLRTLSTAVFVASYVSAAAISSRQAQGGVSALDVLIPSNRLNDQYYTVNIDFNGQTLPLLLDTGSSDIFVASTQCNNTDLESGCYLLNQRYDLSQPTNIIANEPFVTVVGFGAVFGNQSIMPVTFGSIAVPDLATPLIYNAVEKQFQNGSFSGILGLAPRNVSRNNAFYNRLPPVDQMIKQNLLADPVFSLSLPRLGDSGTTGKLTFGGIEERIVAAGVTYNEIINTTNYNYQPPVLAPQSWTSVLEGIRVNGVNINITNRGLLQDDRYLTLVDAGSPSLLVREEEFDRITQALKGELIVYPGHDVYFQCAVPQVIELKIHNRWLPIDPLDMIIPSDHGIINGTEWCHAALGSWDRDFADSLLGVPFLRSVYSVYDYRSKDMYSVQPQVGYAPNVNIEAAVARYGDTYQKRLLSLGGGRPGGLV